MVRGHGGADQASRFVVARGRKIEQQGFVEIVLHVAQRDGRPFRHRSGQRKRLVLEVFVRHHAVDEADRLASDGIDLIRGEHQFARPRRSDQPCQQPGDAIVAAETDPQVAGGNEGRCGSDADVAGHGDGEAGADRGAGQGGDGRLAHRDQRTGQEPLALLQIGDLLVIGHVEFLLVAVDAHALDVAAGAEGGAGAGDQERTDFRVLAAGFYHRAQRRRQMVRQRIADFRPVQRDDRDTVADRAKQFVGAGIDGDGGARCFCVHIAGPRLLVSRS